MNYIYDVTVNFNKELYDFYEWEDSDYPEFVLKIPIFKVDEETFYDMMVNDIMVSREFLEKIKNKSEFYSPNSLKIVKYSCVFVTDELVIAICFDEDGNNELKSVLSIDEEEDILEFSKLFKYTIVDYVVSKKNQQIMDFSTRKEKELSSELIEKINKLYSEEDEVLKYIYYEIYNRKVTDTNQVYFKLLHIIKEKSEQINKIKNIIDLTTKKIMNGNS